MQGVMRTVLSLKKKKNLNSDACLEDEGVPTYLRLLYSTLGPFPLLIIALGFSFPSLTGGPLGNLEIIIPLVRE
jgi:hypothetical protein